MLIDTDATFVQYSEDANYVFDQRPNGFGTIIAGEASTFLNCTGDPDYDCSSDPRLLLNTTVTNITYSYTPDSDPNPRTNWNDNPNTTTNTGVTIHNADGTCIHAAYAICTFSLGVLQQPDIITFSPPLPTWKRRAVNEFQMGTFTKIFLQFSAPFWDTSTQFFLYASPTRRGDYAIFQSLDHPDFLPGSGIFFSTVVG